jgi:hypothetical protein
MQLARLAGTAAALILFTGAWLDAAAVSARAAPGCGNFLTEHIPERPAGAPAGSEFVRQLTGLSDDDREDAIRRQVLSGNIPGFLRRLQPVQLHGPVAGRRLDVTVCVSPDYLAVGTDRNYFFAPMRLQTALIIANRFGFALPTRKLVDAIYAQAATHLQPQPLPASDAMRSTSYYWHHNELVLGQRSENPDSLGLLTAGDKKDLVLTNRLWANPDRVAIYGWHRLDGNAIQPLSTVHGARYADYSHGVRLVSETAFVDGRPTPLMAVLQDPALSPLVSDEGGIRDPARLVDMLSTRDIGAARKSKPREM